MLDLFPAGCSRPLEILMFQRAASLVASSCTLMIVWGSAAQAVDLDLLVVSPRPPDYALAKDGGARVTVCYNWSCAEARPLHFTAGDLETVVTRMGHCQGESLDARLQRLRIGIWQMEVLAQRYLPVLGNDLALNDRDADREGRTDCIDNATNTTTFLSLLHDLDALPEWHVGTPVTRDRFTKDVHWTATVIDRETGERWAVDSWFRPHGHLPFVSPLSDWVRARKPWDPPLDRFNPYPRLADELCDG